MTTLAPAKFSLFFSALWAYDPFPWQERLAQRVCQGGGWPATLDLPTAAGKTAAIDIAVFHLALEAMKGPDRRAPLRIILVVDRRLVVDSAWSRARAIALKLDQAQDGILREVADRLRHLAGEGEQPLAVARLRGGMPRETDWARSICQPLIACSTVDQAGSRLLFRGYGVSDSMKPVHAGLLGTDVLWLIDEAHLSQPLLQTLQSISQFRRPPWVEQEPLSPFAHTAMSATQDQSADVVALDDADLAHDVLGRRLSASKPARLILLGGDLTVDQAAAQYAERALVLSTLRNVSGGANVVAVVVNRVRLARAIHNRLVEEVRSPEEGGDPRADVALLIGPSRPIDREARLKDLLPRMQAQERADGRPLFVVATQTIEVGADLDFDALVTEIAPLDALRQRFGRLNRLGTRTGAPACIIATREEVSARADDPVYGSAARETWNWLKTVASPVKAGSGKVIRKSSEDIEVDFGVQAMQGLMASADLQSLLMLRPNAPVLMPAYIDLWAQTSPPPAIDPDLALFLHGPASAQGDVTIIWRADVPRPPEKAAGVASEVLEGAPAIVGAVPPSALEAVRISIAEARRWMVDTAQADYGDLEGEADAESRRAGSVRASRTLWRWDGENCQAVEAESLRPGDVLVAPASYGGCDGFGWSPTSMAAVDDLAEDAMLQQRHRLALRVQRAVLESDLRREGSGGAADDVWRRIETVLGAFAEERVATLIQELQAVEGLPKRWQMALAALTSGRGRVTVSSPYGEEPLAGRVLQRERVLQPDEVATFFAAPVEGEELVQEPTTEVPATELGGAEIDLDRHCADVEAEVRTSVRGAGLPPSLGEAMALAGKLHDWGKAERRFQALLRGGDFWLVDRQPLAKRGSRQSGAAQQRLRARLGLPPKVRHECWSVRLAEHYLAEYTCADPDLVLWLIGVHHGWGRPFFPPVIDREGRGMVRATVDGVSLSAPVDHGLTALSAGWPDRFERLQRRYGAWELARLEALLRLADHRASAREAESEGKDR